MPHTRSHGPVSPTVTPPAPFTATLLPLVIMQNARDAIANAVTAEPNLAEVQTAFGNFNFWLGWDWFAAEAAYRRAIALDLNLPLAHRMLGVVLSHSCRPAESLEVLQTLEAVARERFVPPYAIALIHAGLGHTDLALDWLARAFESHDVHLVFLPVDPKWDPFRIEPRFMVVLKRRGFTERRA